MFHYPDKNQALFKNLNLPSLKKIDLFAFLSPLKVTFIFLIFCLEVLK